MISAVLLIIITIFVPPIGVLMISGCGADFLINVLLTLLGYLPGHIHAFYLEYVYYHRKEARQSGLQPDSHQGVYSQRDQGVVGQQQQAYGTMPPPQGPYVGQEEGVVRKG